MNETNLKQRKDITREHFVAPRRRTFLGMNFSGAVFAFSVIAIIVGIVAWVVIIFHHFGATEQLSAENAVLEQECEVLQNSVDKLTEENDRLTRHDRVSESASALGMFECPESDRDYVTVPGGVSEGNKTLAEKSPADSL